MRGNDASQEIRQRNAAGTAATEVNERGEVTDDYVIRAVEGFTAA